MRNIITLAGDLGSGKGTVSNILDTINTFLEDVNDILKTTDK